MGGWVVTFNNEVCCKIKTGLAPSFEGAVKAEPLRAVLENLGEDTVLFDVRGEPPAQTLVVRGEARAAQVKIRMEADILLPVEEVEKPEYWDALPAKFPDAVKLVAQAAGTNIDEFLTTCIHVHPNWLESCDRWQATRYRLDTGVDEPFLVRAKSLLPMASMDMTDMSVTPGWVHFRNAKVRYSARRHLEKYPSLEKMLATTGEHIKLPEGAEAAARLAEIFSAENKDNNKVMVTLASDLMTVTGQGSHGEAEEPLRMNYRGDPTQFRVAPDLLVKMVKDYKTCQIAPGMMRVDGEDWVHATVLGKAKKAEPEANGKHEEGKNGNGKPRGRPERVGREEQARTADGSDPF